MRPPGVAPPVVPLPIARPPGVRPPCSLHSSCVLTRGLLMLRLQLCCSRCLDTSRFLTSCQQTLRLQLCRNPSRGFDARRYFLTSGLLSLRLQSCCCHSCTASRVQPPVAQPRHVPLLPEDRPPASRPQPAPSPTDPPVWQVQRSLPNVPTDSLPCQIAGISRHCHHGLRDRSARRYRDHGCWRRGSGRHDPRGPVGCQHVYTGRLGIFAGAA